MSIRLTVNGDTKLFLFEFTHFFDTLKNYKNIFVKQEIRSTSTADVIY